MIPNLSPIVGPIVAAVFAVLAIFGVNFSEDVQKAIAENLVVVVSGLVALFALLPSVLAPLRDRFGKKTDDPPPPASKLFSWLLAAAMAGVLLAGTATLPGCAMPGTAIEAPVDTLNKRAVVAYATAEGATKMVVALYDRKRITRDEALEQLRRIDQSARAVETAIAAGSAPMLEMALTGLLALEAALKVKEAGK